MIRHLRSLEKSYSRPQEVGSTCEVVVKALPAKLESEPRGEGSGSTSVSRTELCRPSTMGSMRREKRCWW